MNKLKELTQKDIEQYFEEKNIDIKDFLFHKLNNLDYLKENFEQIVQVFNDNRSPYFCEIIKEIDKENDFFTKIFSILKNNQNLITHQNMAVLDDYIMFDLENENKDPALLLKYEKNKNYYNFLTDNKENPNLLKLLLKYELFEDLKEEYFSQYIEKNTLKKLHYYISKKKKIFSFIYKLKPYYENIFVFSFLILFISFWFMLFNIKNSTLNVWALTSVCISALISVLSIIMDCIVDKNKGFTSIKKVFEKIFAGEEKYLPNYDAVSWQEAVAEIEYKDTKELENFEEIKLKKLLNKAKEKNLSVEKTLNAQVSMTKESLSPAIDNVINKITQTIVENKKLNKDLKSIQTFDTYFDKLSSFSTEVMQQQEADIVKTLENIHNCLLDEIAFLKEKESIDMKIMNKSLSLNV